MAARAAPVAWALERLLAIAAARGLSAALLDDAEPEGDGALVVVGTPRARRVSELLATSGLTPPADAEALALAPIRGTHDPSLVACGADARGLTYAVLELVDRMEHDDDPIEALRLDDPVLERPANAVRSVARLFCSEVEDKGWFHDEAFWDRYLSMLVSQRFNRFSLTLGLGYNYHRDVTDAYLYFAYPFLLSVPGYDVRVPQLPDEERERNLAMLRFISERAVGRGLDFQLGLWTHAYEWIDSPSAHHTVEGLTPETHGPYCRDAVGTLLDACPAIGGLTFRVHGESGVPEGSWGFWRTVFEGVAAGGRRVGLDLHAKGLDEQVLGHALDTGLPITVSPKYWAEHMGLPYHQAAIRERERLPREDPSHLSQWHRSMRVSEGSRPFTRYGYGDFLREDRPYDVVFRLWAGTQRLLLWGDPAMAAGYGRVSSIAGTKGLEWCEPLTFKGREGTGLQGPRTGYADPSLVPEDDWAKYAYTYRLFGRLTYDPGSPPESWRRPLRARFGEAALDAESALASASRILPLVTVAHHPSASNNSYWPEIYTDMPIVWTEQGTRPHPYHDTPEPRRFGTVSPLDPEVFASVRGFVEEFLNGPPSGRVSPLLVARWLDRLAESTSRSLAAVQGHAAEDDPDLRRWAADITIVSALGRFFAGKLRAAVGYELHEETGSREALRFAVEAYRSARRAWQVASEGAGGTYVADLTFGPQERIRGHWAARLPAIDADLGDLEDRWSAASSASDASDGPADELAIRGLLEEAARPLPDVELIHTPPSSFVPAADLPLDVEVRGLDAATVDAVTLRYRPMNQALAVEAADMDRSGARFTALIPGDRLSGAYPLAYAFVVRGVSGRAWRVPGLGEDLCGQPYLVVRSELAGRERSPRAAS